MARGACRGRGAWCCAGVGRLGRGFGNLPHEEESVWEGANVLGARSAWGKAFLILERWGLARLAFGEQPDRFTV